MSVLSDTTYGELREIAARYPQPRSGLLPMLHLVQAAEGRVTPEGIEACAAILGLTAAEVSGVATFYTMYKRKPVGDYHVGVCTNTLCAVMGGDEILTRLKDHLGVGNDETTDDVPGQRSITLEHVECNAACDYAPVVMVNWEFVDNQTPDSAVALVDDLRAGREVSSTRGARLCTWREAERVLAGFPDGRADEGPSAGPASLAGLSIARERGWTAPSSPLVEEGPPGPVSKPGDAVSTSSTTDKGGSTTEKGQLSSQRDDSRRSADESTVEQTPAGTKHEDTPGRDEEAK